MKVCAHCGRENDPASAICVGCGTELAAAGGAARSATAPPRIVCPHCGAPDDSKPAMALRGSFSWLFFLLGGILAVVLRNAGRARRVHCNSCGAFFSVRTPMSRVSIVLLWLLVWVPLLLILLWLLVALIGSLSRK